jgi:hypothetical protein
VQVVNGGSNSGTWMNEDVSPEFSGQKKEAYAFE